MIRVVLSAWLMGALALGAACRKGPAASTNTAAPKAGAAKAAAAGSGAAAVIPTAPPWATDATKPVPAELPDVIARVNGEPVTKVDFDRVIKNMEATAGKPIPADRRNELLRGAIDELVTLTILSQESKARNITVPDAEVDRNLAQLRQSFKGTDQQFQAALAARGMSSEQMRSDAVTQLRINKMMQAEVSTVAGASEAEAREFYDKNQDRFKPEEVRASHILIRVPNNDPAVVKKAQTRAATVLQQAQAGADFAALAKKYSDDASKANGGDLNFIRRGTLPREFEDTAFSLQKGQVSGLVATQFGFHIIKTTDRRVQPPVPFEEVSSQVRELLFSQRKDEKGKAFVDALKKKAKVEVLI